MAQRMKRRSTRRRSTSRRSTIRRRARRTAKSGFSIGKKIFPIAKNLASPVAFVEQISSKHRQTLGASYTNAPIGQKFKILTNIVLGSTTGLNPFKNEFQAPISQLKIGNIINKWSTAGIAMLGYGIIAKQANKALGSNLMPAIAPVKSIGKQLVIGGALGGLFDDAPKTGTAVSGTANIAPAMTTTMSYNGGYSSGSDSTESSL